MIAAGPTAAEVTAGGRVIGGARVKVYDPNGSFKAAITNPFGYYQCENVTVGATYIFEVSSKRKTFASATQAQMILNEFQTVSFVAEN